MTHDRPLHPIIADAALLVRLMDRDQLCLCAQLRRHRVVVVDQVRHQLQPAEQAVVDEAVRDGILRLESITELGDLRRMAGLAERLGRGEAACLVLAAARHGSVGSDDQGRFGQEIARWLGSGRRVGWAELVALADSVEDRPVVLRRHG